MKKWRENRKVKKKQRNNYNLWDTFLDILLWIPELLFLPFRLFFWIFKVFFKIIKNIFDDIGNLFDF